MENEIEVMRVYRVPPKGHLVAEFRGQRFQNISEITDDNIRQLLLAAIGELITFAGGYQNLVDAGLAPPVSTSGQATIGDTGMLRQKQADFLSSLERDRDKEISKPAPKPKFPILSGIRPSIPRPSSSTDINELSLAKQIDIILQKHIAADPELRDRSIHLVQGPGGNLQIDVDGRRYKRPKDLQEKRIQILIKRAITEWEKS